ncbi:MAG: hypothetical protein ACRDGT_11755, partial [Candidatus Limnocylindria bacterium]
MGPRLAVHVARLRSGRSWLRTRGPVTLAAALLLEVSSATPSGGARMRGLLRAGLLTLLLLGVLIAAAADGAVTALARQAHAAWTSAALWSRANVLGLPVPLRVPDALLLDRSGRPLRGGARKARLGMLEREHARLARERSLRGRG